MKLRNILFLLFFAVVTFSFFYFRLYNLHNRIIFNWDQEALSFQLKKIIVERRPILIGPRATDAMGFYFGPYLQYLVVPFYLISNMHPSGLIVFIYFVNILFYILTFFVIRKIFDKYIATALLLFWGLNYVLIVIDTTAWGPILVGVGISLTFLFAWRLYKKPSYISYLLLGLTVGFFTHMHSAFIFMDFFVFSFLVALFRSSKKYSYDFFKKISLLIGMAAIFLAPLLLFDLRHDFLNSKLFLGYFLTRIGGEARIIDSLQVFSNFFKPLLGSASIWVGLIFYIGILFGLIYLIKRRKGFRKLFYIASLCVWSLTALIYLRYTQRPSEYYFIYLYPIAIIALVDLFSRFNRYAIIVVCLFFLLSNFNSLKNITKSNDQGLFAKEATVLLLKENIKNKQFNLVYDMPLGLDNGYEYFLDYHKIKPSGDSKDPLVVFHLPKKAGDISINSIGIQIPPELKR